MDTVTIHMSGACGAFDVIVPASSFGTETDKWEAVENFINSMWIEGIRGHINNPWVEFPRGWKDDEE